jgi:hypothetical protein
MIKPITKESIVGPCWYRINGDGEWKKGLLIDNGDGGIITMENKIPLATELNDYQSVTALPINDMNILLGYANKRIMTSGPFKANQATVEDLAKKFNQGNNKVECIGRWVDK